MNPFVHFSFRFNVFVLLLCSNQFRPIHAVELEYDTDVIIIGAGIAGITCARELINNGFTNFIILEGRNATGGRFQDVSIGNVTVELGPNWVHGTTNNPIFQLVQRFGVRGQLEDPKSVICRDWQGRNVTHEFLEKRAILKSITTKLGTQYSNMSLRDALKMNGWKNDTEMDNIAEYSLIDYMDAVPPELISGEFNSKRQTKIDSLFGPQFFITDQNGYKKLIHGLEKEVLAEDPQKLKLNHNVERIYWNERGVRVKTTENQAYTAKVLVTTASNGAYQNLPSFFEPKLPHWKQNALQKIKMATYTKLFLKFPYRFWDNVEYIFYAAQKRGLFPVWQSLDASNRFDQDTNILLITITESESYRIENVTKDAIIDEIMGHLRSVFGANIPFPVDIIVPKWSSDEFFYGSYSFLPVNVSHNDFVALRANVGPIFFAGEATHEVYQGYIHGAYFEGKNRALDVLQALKGYWDTSSNHLNHDYYDSCLKDSCNCCYK